MGLGTGTPLDTRLGRRLLGLFVLCAVVPVSVLAALSLRSVSRHLREQTTAYLRQEAKSFAMSLLERLDLLQRELADLDRLGAADGRRNPGSFTAAGCVSGSGAARLLVGGAPGPQPPAEARRRLRAGRATIQLIPQPGANAAVVLLTPSAAGGFCWGEVRPEELWKRGSTIPPRTELSVGSAEGLRLLSSGGVPESVEAEVFARWARESSGTLSWRDRGEEFQGTFWTIPMAGNFGTANWVVSLHLPRSAALAPVHDFRGVFGWVVLLSLMVVVLAASRLIRRTLTPLGRLLDATRRLASQDFAVELEPSSDDEIGELSVAFSRMAAQLRDDFSRLAASARLLGGERARLAGLVEHLPYGVVLLDAEDRVELANNLARGYLGQLGVDGGDQLGAIAGQSLRELAALGVWRELSLDGVARRAFAVAARDLAADAEAPDLVVMLRDVTEDREVQRQLQQQDRLAAVGQLAAGMAHDLNNVLQGIGMCAELLRPELSSAAAGTDLDTLQRLHERAAAIIRQVLDFSRRSESAPRPLELVAAVEEVLVLLQRTLTTTLRFRLTVGAGAGDVVVAFDPVQLHQVLANLALNARDAMPEGGDLELGVRLVPPPGGRAGDWVCLAVRDTGTGIPPELQARVFDPFFTTKPVGRGTGLGLSQVYGIVAQQGGVVELESQPGVGTEIRVLLPVAVGSEKPPPESRPPAPALRPVVPLHRRVLLVEDEPAVLDLIRRHFEFYGFAVITAANGRQALALLDQAGPFDIALCDVVMPELGGREMLRDLRHRSPGTRIVLMSGYAGPDTVDSKGPQPDGWLQKPFKASSLRRLVAEVLGGEPESPAAQRPPRRDAPAR